MSFSSSQLSRTQGSQGKSKLELLLLLKISLRYYYRFTLLLLEMTKSRKRNKEEVSKEREGNVNQVVGCTRIKSGFGAKELIILPPALPVFQSFS